MSAFSKDFERRLAASAIPAEACRRWRGEAASLSMVKCHSRLVFRFEREGAGYFLKLAYGVQAASEAVEKCNADTAYVAHLASRGVPVNTPVVSQADQFVEIFESEGVPIRASVTVEVEGQTVNGECADPAVLARCGETLGFMHAASEDYVGSGAVAVVDWRDEWRQTAEWIPGSEPVLQGEYDAIDAWLGDRDHVPGGMGLTHADCHTENFIDSGHAAALIDFDEIAISCYGRDIGRFIRDYRHQNKEMRSACFAALMAGYRRARPHVELTAEDIAWFIRMEHLEMYMWFYANAKRAADRNKPYMKEWRSRIDPPFDWP